MRGKFAMELRASLESNGDGIDALATDAPVVTTDEVVATVADTPDTEVVEVEVVALPNEVVDEVVVDNSDSLEEAIEETAAAETALNDNVEQVEELDEAAAGLESIYIALQEMGQGKKVDSTAIRATNLAIESYAARVGLNDSLNVSVESFNLTASMESIRETLKKMWDAAIKFLIEIKNKVVAFFKRVFTAAGRLEARGKKLSSLNLSGQPTEKSFVVKGLAKRLAIGKSVYTDPEKGLFELIKTVDSCVQWEKGLAESNDKIRQFLVEAAKSPNATVYDKALQDFNDFTALGAPKGFTKIDSDKEWGWKSPVLPGNVRFIGLVSKVYGELALDNRTFLLGARIHKVELSSFDDPENKNVPEETAVPTLSAQAIKRTASTIRWTTAHHS